MRRDPRVALTTVSDEPSDMRDYLSVMGTAHVTEGGAPELLAELSAAMTRSRYGGVTSDQPAGYVTHIRIERIGGVGPWKPWQSPTS